LVSKALIFIFSLFWRIFLRKTGWVLRNFRVCGGFPVEEPNGCKFIEKNLGLFWVSSSSVNGRMNIVRISEFVLS
jgi:hypothetical protein